VPKLTKKSRKKPIIKIVLIGLALAILMIVFLELGYRSCPSERLSFGGISCYQLIEKYPSEKNWQPIKETETLEEVISKRVHYVDRSEIKGANGVTCFYTAFVAKDLPKHAEKYVATHEAIHLMGELDETKTNYLAAQKEPFGVVQTIVYSVYLGLGQLKKTPVQKYPCLAGLLWLNFKVYFLGFSF
jgi:hypothetical protein